MWLVVVSVWVLRVGWNSIWCCRLVVSGGELRLDE